MNRDPMWFPWLWLARRAILNGLFAACVLVAVAAAFVGGQYMERHGFASTPAQVADGVRALQSGDNQLAFAALKPLADAGNAQAQFWLADLYANGLGVGRDTATAVALLEKSAQQGFVPAERRLGEIYLNGDETLQDFGEATSWLHKAATAGDDRAQRDLGRMYALGLGVSRDPAQAYAWYEAAALNGDGAASQHRDRLVTQMSPDEMARGERLAKSIAGGGSTSRA